MLRLSRILGGVLALSIALAPAVSATAEETPPSDESHAAQETGKGRKVIGDGHIDIGPRFDGKNWTVQVRDDTVEPPTWRNTSDVVFQVGPQAKVKVPEGNNFSFLGKAGEQIYLLPQVQKDGLLWPGWNSQEPKVASVVKREVTWRLKHVTGPGRFILFLNESFGEPKVLFDSSKKLPQETGIESNSHVHGNWAFQKPGTYLLDVEMTASGKDGEKYQDTQVLRFSVGSQNPRKAFSVKSSADGKKDKDGTSTRQQGDNANSVETVWWYVAASALLLLTAILGIAVWRRRGLRGADHLAVRETEGTD